MTNVIDFNKTTQSDEPEHNYQYRITTKDGVVHEVTGYVIINQLFVGVARGEGVLYWSCPFDALKTLENLGPVSTTLN